MSKRDETVAARLTIYDAAEMNQERIRNIISWLKELSKFVSKDHKEFSKRFVARYIVDDNIYGQGEENAG